MPQMMPINWILSFIFFIIMFIMFNMMNYFIFNYNINKNKFLKKNFIKNIYWKW